MKHMEPRVILILIGVVIFYGLSIIYIINTFRKERKEKDRFEKQQRQIFNKCIDLVISRNDQEAKNLYNKGLIDYDSKRKFLYGLFIGLDIEKNKAKLIDAKY